MKNLREFGIFVFDFRGLQRISGIPTLSFLVTVGRVSRWIL